MVWGAILSLDHYTTKGQTEMFRKLLTILTTSVLFLGGAELSPRPASASYGGDCAFNAICLYQWVNYGSPDGTRWQSSLNNIWSHTAGCLNIPPALWSNGDDVNNNSAALQLIGTSTWGHYGVFFYNWVECNPAGGVVEYSGGSVLQEYDLHNRVYTLNNPPAYTLYHSITSIKVELL